MFIRGIIIDQSLIEQVCRLQNIDEENYFDIAENIENNLVGYIVQAIATFKSQNKNVK